MVDKATIQSAKAVGLDIILNEFGWEKNSYGNIRCPHPDHSDRTPSCSCSASRNTCKCFGCGEVFDTIDLYQCLSEKVNGRAVPFYKAVEEILELDAVGNGNIGSLSAINGGAQNKGNQFGCKNSQRNIQAGNGRNSSPYEKIIRNSSSLKGYELNYLHGRGIMLYDSYVHKGEVHTAQGIEKALQTVADQNEINRLDEIRNNGIFYKGIVNVLKANRIQVMHNYWQGMNSIIYLVDYDADEEDDLCWEQFFMGTERHMAVQKTLDGSHVKRALGTSDFTPVTRGFEHNKNKDIYICEGIEDSLTYAMNGFRSISLNSTANLKSLVHYLSEEYVPCHKDRFIISLDHDERGEVATGELKQFFESYNHDPSNRYQYSYAVCRYPKQFKDINDYWVSKVFR